MAREGRQRWRFWGRSRQAESTDAPAGPVAHELLQQQRLPEAEEVYRELWRSQPDNPAGLAGLAWVAMHRGEWHRALDLWNQCLDRFSSREQMGWHIARSRTLFRMGREREAEAACLAAAEKWPADIRPLKQLISFANRTDRPRAVALLDRLIALVPGDLEARVSRARMVAALGAPEECRALVDAVLWGDSIQTPLSDALLENLLEAIQWQGAEDRMIGLLERLGERAREHATSSQSVSAEIVHARVRLALEDYEEARRIVTRLRDRGVRGEPVEGMSRMCERYFDPMFPDFGAAKVFCIGLSKTATSSLDSALKMLGLQTLHWTNPYTKALIADRDLVLFDGFSDIGISWQFERLYDRFPNARFIYTTRPLEGWVRSITSHYERVHGVREPKALRQPGFQQRFQGAAGQAEMNLYGGHDSWEACYREFDRRVRRFFADKPADTFLELAICEGEGWDKLCGFLGVPVPAVPFPVANSAPEVHGDGASPYGTA